MRKKILIVGMLDSIHLARWVNQFVDSDNDLVVFPSTHYRRIHKKLRPNNNPNIRVVGLLKSIGLSGYIDSIITCRVFGKSIAWRLRNFYLRILIFIHKPDIIHAIEIQHAGYLVSSISAGPARKILTNWGSDIYYFGGFPSHQTSIRKSLTWATHYSAECSRDYQLARDFGFLGIELPKIPNAGGFMQQELTMLEITRRDQLIVKCYGGTFGLGKTAISVCESFLEKQLTSRVFLYSVTEDLISLVSSLKFQFPNRVRYSTLAKPLTHEALLEEFRKSKVYLGLSRSDGLSTSFLEALSTGTYPIQTNTSCAGEVIELGAIGSIVKPDFPEVLQELLNVFNDNTLLKRASELNLRFAKEFLDFAKIKEIALTYYV
jgi:glycosyltransferase involved in cell wall biosynthesis